MCYLRHNFIAPTVSLNTEDMIISPVLFTSYAGYLYWRSPTFPRHPPLGQECLPPDWKPDAIRAFQPPRKAIVVTKSVS